MPNTNNSTIIRFFGVIDEKQNFKRLPGYTLDEHTKSALIGKGSYKVVLQNSRKEEIASFIPEVDFDWNACPGVNETRTAIVKADIPLKQGGETIALLYNDESVYEEKVNKEIPQLKEISVKPFNGKNIPKPIFGDYGFAVMIDNEDAFTIKNAKLMAVNWEVNNQNENLHADILILGDRGIYGRVATDLIKGPFVINMAGLSSSNNRVVVRVSNGFQSVSMSSEETSSKKLPPRLDIIEPNPEKGIRAYSPFNLFARIHDPTVMNPEKRFQWRINDEIVQEGSNLALGPSLDPGKYQIKVLYISEEQEVQSQIDIQVLQPDEVYEKWLKQAERF